MSLDLCLVSAESETKLFKAVVFTFLEPGCRLSRPTSHVRFCPRYFMTIPFAREREFRLATLWIGDCGHACPISRNTNLM